MFVVSSWCVLFHGTIRIFVTSQFEIFPSLFSFISRPCFFLPGFPFGPALFSVVNEESIVIFSSLVVL